MNVPASTPPSTSPLAPLRLRRSFAFLRPPLFPMLRQAGGLKVGQACVRWLRPVRVLAQAGGLKDFSRWLSEAWRATPPETRIHKNSILKGCQTDRLLNPKAAIGNRVAQTFLSVPGSCETFCTDKNVCATFLCNPRPNATFGLNPPGAVRNPFFARAP